MRQIWVSDQHEIDGGNDRAQGCEMRFIVALIPAADRSTQYPHARADSTATVSSPARTVMHSQRATPLLRVLSALPSAVLCASPIEEDGEIVQTQHAAQSCGVRRIAAVQWGQLKGA